MERVLQLLDDADDLLAWFGQAWLGFAWRLAGIASVAGLFFALGLFLLPH